MKVLMVKPGYAPYEVELNGLKEMRAAVGGLIQCIYPFQERAALVCNDEGLLLGLPYNRSVPGGYGGIFGTFFICGIDKEDFCSLSPEQIAAYKRQFHAAEILIGMCGNEPVTLRVSPKNPAKFQHEPERDAPSGRE